LSQISVIEQNYIAQTGDPTNTGGGESIFGLVYGQNRFFTEEKLHNPRINHVKRGLISMVNNGSDEFGSQFFFTLGDNLDYLDKFKHCVFGEVGDGLETLHKLNEELADSNNCPFRDIRISHTSILHDPFADPPGLKIPSRSPSPTSELINVDNKIPLCDSVNEDEGKTVEQIREEMEQKEMKAQAQILEMVGDLHYADEKPPDNVLFVCKLNPVTTDEDLEVIFSRFGPIKCSEVIRDRRTGSSLQYAFIEFEKPEHCDAAYMKMDNVLIDDRRIHVDFSQSVSKNYQWIRGDSKRPNTSERLERSKEESRSKNISSHKEREKYHKSHRPHSRSGSRSVSPRHSRWPKNKRR